MRTRRTLLLPLLASLLIPAAVVAAPDRGYIEDGTTGTKSDGAASTVSGQSAQVVVFGQTSATLVSPGCSSGTCTRAAPSGALEGLDLDSVESYRVETCLFTLGDAGVPTFSGGGTGEIWVMNEVSGRATSAFQWTKVIDTSLSLASASGLRCVSWSTKKNSFKPSDLRLVIRFSGVTVSDSNAQMRTTVTACTKRGCGA